MLPLYVLPLPPVVFNATKLESLKREKLLMSTFEFRLTKMHVENPRIISMRRVLCGIAKKTMPIPRTLLM